MTTILVQFRRNLSICYSALTCKGLGLEKSTIGVLPVVECGVSLYRSIALRCTQSIDALNSRSPAHRHFKTLPSICRGQCLAIAQMI